MEIARGQGNIVSGSDVLDGGHSQSNIHKDLDLVVYSAAVGERNIELVKAGELGIKMMTRGEFLGDVMSGFDVSIAIGGAHGKTTTTAMMSEVLKDLWPKVHIGTDDKLAALGSSALLNSTQHDNKHNSHPQSTAIFITEACEYKKSFLKLKPDITVVLNMDLDHTDCYQNLDDAKDAFYEFAGQAKKVAIVGEEFNERKMQNAKRLIKVGLKNDCDIRAGRLKHDKNGNYNYCLFINNKFKARIHLKVSGKHNVYNSLFVIAAALELGLSLDQIKKGIARFEGIGRRLEKLSVINDIAIYSDYAHHPKEIDCTLASMRECGYEHILICFEPHTYTRTASFYKEFAKSLSKADEVLLLPIFAAREQKIDGIMSDLIEKEMKKSGFASVICADDYVSVCEYVKEWMQAKGEGRSGEADSKDYSKSAVVFMGAGTIDGAAREFISNLSY